MSSARFQTPEAASAALLQEPARRTDAFLKRWLRARTGIPDLLREAVGYSLFGPGKRIRPALALLTCEAVGGRPEQALPAAGALELIHCFSLVHDDLPAMDNDNLRRGRPTNHKVYGETVAILAGDAMHTLAFELLADTVKDPALAQLLIRELATASGPAGMIGGQLLDTCGERHYGSAKKSCYGTPSGGRRVDLLQRIHRMKTGALITAACRMGARCGGADDPLLRIVQTMGRAVGLAFQIVDDLLDATATQEQLGKRTGKDAPNGKLTYPSLLGIAESRRRLQRQQAIAERMTRRIGPRAQRLAEVIHILARRDR